MDKPTGCQFIPERQTSILFFEDKDAGEYMVRGSVCFPILIDVPSSNTKDIVGYALLGCQNVETGVVHIFEQQEFSTIDHIITDQRITHKGLNVWFNMCWSKYFGRKFFYAQDYELCRKYRLDIHRSAMLNPKPEMIEIETHDSADMQHFIWSYIKNVRLVYESGSVLHNLLAQMKTNDKVTHPAIYALQVLLCAYDRFPYRKKEISQ